MRQGILAALGVLLILGILAGLSALTYTQKEKTPDREAFPNRSTYNTGATGTNAFYSLLAETGHKVVRWPDAPTALTTARTKPGVFVLVGTTRRELNRTDADALMNWVAGGGRLVIIDRDPPTQLARTSSNWRIAVSSVPIYDIYSTDPQDVPAMTKDTAAVKPAQPGLFTHGVTSVQPSRFAGSVTFERMDEADIHPFNDDILATGTYTDVAPNAHFAAGGRPIVVDVQYGSGKIVYLTDPYIVSNAGIGLADNARLAVNLVNVEGTIAFDEYHQGYGSGSNRFLEFFAGTPAIAILLQSALLVGSIFYSQSRRFARPVPEAEPDRLSKLEYVGAMAELQERTRAFDLAIENIYADFRRRVSRQLGLNEATPKAEAMARAISERLGIDANDLRSMFLRSESIIYGDATNKAETLDLTVRLRELERRLNLRRGETTRL